MTEKEKLLNTTYAKFMDIGLNINPSYDILEEFAVEDVMGFGTAVDEKLFTLSALRELLITQEKLLKGVETKWERTPVLRHIAADGNSAVFADDIIGTMMVENETLQMYLRFSSVLEFIGNKWMLVHWHGSKPENVQSEVDGFGIDKWKQRNAELEKLVDEKTVDLLIKNRELEIETALERVRAIALSMNKPADMLEVCRVISQQSESLGIKEIRNVQTVIINEQKGTYVNYQYFAAYDQSVVEEVDYHKHPTVEEMAEKMISSPDAFFAGTFEGEEIEKFRNYRKQDNQLPDPILDAAYTLDYYFYSIGPGGLGLSTYKPLSEDGLDVFKQFHKVFSLAYRRFLDIENAVAQAREAQIEVALERVRAKAMAMRNSSEIGNLIHHLYTELTQLDAQLDRCFIMIVDPENNGITWWLAGKEGLLNENGFYIQNNLHPSHKLYLEYWRNRQKKWQYVFEGKEKAEWDQFGFTETGLAKLPEAIKKDMASIGKIYLSGSSDSFGCLVTGSLSPLSADHVDIICRFSIVFNQTYTRFLDLQKAEAQACQAEQDLIAIKEARQNAEEALKELQATQKQLIQSEKMASLGELTAGIAHEIQNPLNFVNNFSEVSSELLAEMNSELEKGDIAEAKAIAADVRQNLEKINHHGKRAADIVKGMLQHSRTSSGQKEPTDLNALADEYLRLSYHGLRAKDKSFNASLKTDFDETIGKINIIPQDIGRVILNMLTNAYYAVEEKKKLNIEGYESVVSIATKRIGNQVKITVGDNGNGIPQKVLDKIFQPFFTTKPTGEGTGLGLSLSYDIITKGHGGEMKVETNEGEGSTFCIILTA